MPNLKFKIFTATFHGCVEQNEKMLNQNAKDFLSGAAPKQALKYLLSRQYGS